MKNLKKLVILHSNDMHGDFLQEKIDDRLVGGVSMLSGYINQVREEEANVIYAVAGDMFRGSVIDSEYLGLSTIEIMNMLAPDVVTLGNHETDYGLTHLLFIERCAQFPIINANLHITINNARLFQPYHIIEMDGMKILFIGILTEEVMNQTKKDGLVGSVVSIAEAAEEVGRICNAFHAEDIDLTVLLTHIGYEEDKHLASLLDPSWGVDVIIGGHSHTLPEKPAEVNGILIVQAGTGTDQIGRFDILVDTDANCVDSYIWKSVPIDETHCRRDEQMENLIARFKEPTDLKYSRVITRFRRELTHPAYEQETELGGMLADTLKNALGLDIFLLGSGSIRTQRLGPIVTFGDLCTAFPYDDPVYACYVTGAQLREMLRYMLRDEVWEGKHCEFFQLSRGLRVTYNRTAREFERFDFNGAPVRDDRIYSIGLQKFHYDNFEDDFHLSLDETAANRKPRIVSTSCRTILEEVFSQGHRLDRKVSGRLVLTD